MSHWRSAGYHQLTVTFPLTSEPVLTAASICQNVGDNGPKDVHNILYIYLEVEQIDEGFRRSDDASQHLTIFMTTKRSKYKIRKSDFIWKIIFKKMLPVLFGIIN